jgi:hypothetical protein
MMALLKCMSSIIPIPFITTILSLYEVGVKLTLETLTGSWFYAILNIIARR